MEYILWAVKVGEPDWAENVITEAKNLEQLEKAKNWALENGFEKLRVMTYKGEVPDFNGALNV